jgi:hypothetical protein
MEAPRRRELPELLIGLVAVAVAVAIAIAIPITAAILGDDSRRGYTAPLRSGA